MKYSDLFITGITGFVGQNLLIHQRKKNPSVRIRAHVRKQTRAAGELTVELGGVDVLEELESDGMGENQHYIHLAGKAHDLKNVSGEEEYFQVNYGLTKRLFDHFIQDPAAESFVFISSVKAVSDSPAGELDESYQPEPVTAYGRSKLKAEEYILEQCPPGKKVYILRPCMIHGPGNKGNLNLLHAVISRGLPWPLGAFNNSRSFLSVQNLCFVIEMILSGRLAPDVYHIADSRPLSTNRLVELIAESTGRKPTIWNIPAGVIRSGAKLGNILPLPLNEERLQKLTENFVVSNRKLTRALGCDLPVETEEGMRSTLASFTQS